MTEFKLPKSIILAGVEWDIVQCKEEYGGSFVNATHTIEIGTTVKKNIPIIFLHEVIEAIMAIRCHRYRIYDSSTNEKILFSFNHAQFENMIMDISMALKGIKF